MSGGVEARAPRRRRVAAVPAATLTLALLLAGCTPQGGGAVAEASASTPAPSQQGPDGGGTQVPTQGPATATPSPTLPATPTASPSPTSPATPSASASPSSTASPSPTASPDPAATPSPEPEPEPEPELLRAGDEGEAVAQVQRRLVELGYFLPVVDGDFGYGTLQAVWALQKAAGITRDGVVGPDTRAAMDAGTRPTARSTTGTVIEIDLTTQLVLAVQDGQVLEIVNASSGNGATYEALGRTHTAYTPRGEFTAIRRIDGWHESGLELGTMYRPVYFLSGWAIHGSPSVPPYPASHGCVRVSNDAMDWIWDEFGAPLGTPILVYRS